jgi:hypothetical protein
MKRALLAGLALVVPLAPSLLAKRKDDVVVMRNGDRMSGEIKRLEKGQLFFQASYMLDPVALDWSKVERIESKDNFNVSLTNGEIHTGLIAKQFLPEESAPDFLVTSEGQTMRTAHDEVVSIVPMERTFLHQLTGAVDYGYSYTGGTNATTQSSLSGSLGYRSPKWSLEMDGSSVFNSQSEGTSTGRNAVSALYAKYLNQKWFAGVLSELLNSHQQDLTLRTTAGGGLGRVLYRSEHSSLVLLSGLMFSRERYAENSGGPQQASNAEAMFYMKYDTFRFKTFNLYSVFYTYPSLTDRGRVRMGVQPALKIEIFRSCYWKFSLYENFDSRPPVRAPRNDFGTSTSIGWTF